MSLCNLSSKLPGNEGTGVSASTTNLGISVSIPEEIPEGRQPQVVLVVLCEKKLRKSLGGGEAWKVIYQFLRSLPSCGVWD